MKPLLTSVLIFWSIAAAAQIHWKETTRWKVYKTGDRSIFSIPIDSLIFLKCYALNDDSMRIFLDSTIQVPKGIIPTWMGGFLASCMYKGKIRKVDISSYGGFFYDEQTKTYIQIPDYKK